MTALKFHSSFIRNVLIMSLLFALECLRMFSKTPETVEETWTDFSHLEKHSVSTHTHGKQMLIQLRYFSSSSSAQFLWSRQMDANVLP